MQRIFYAGGTFMTGDDIADALFEFSRALGAEEKAELVRLPIIGEDGLEGMATLLIGPASQIIATSVRSVHPDPVDTALVERLRTLTRGVSFPEGSELEPEVGRGLEDEL